MNVGVQKQAHCSAVLANGQVSKQQNFNQEARSVFL
jgi:hypothetical protein